MASSFQPEQILRVLVEHDVKFVVIGGLAATLHGSPHLTQDVDITPATDRENLSRLSDALRELEAKVRAVELDEPLPFAHDADSLATIRVLNLATRFGDLDISQVPAGTEGFPDLSRDAVTVSVRGMSLRVASLADVIRSKQAANRQKDHVTLNTLRELLARQRDQRRPDRV